MKISILMILIVIAFLIWFNSSNRENFTSLNPIITQADYDSISNNKNLTANATILTNWLNKNTTMSIYDLPAFAYNLQKYGTIVPSLSGPPNVDDFLRQMLTTLNTDQDQLETIYNDYKAGLNSSTSWFSNAIYTYYFGTAPPAPPAPPSPSISGNTTSTIVPPKKSTPPSISGNTSSTTVPPKKSTSPCYPEFKSIPGGTMEFRCFNS